MVAKMVNEVNRNYSIPHRIWRIIYPVLIFFSVQFVVSIATGLTYVFSVIFREAFSNTANYDSAMILEELMTFIYENIMLIVLASNVVSLCIFTPMWIKTRKHNERFQYSGKATVALLTAGFFAGFNIIQVFVFSITDIMRFFPSYEELAGSISGGPFYIQVISIGIVAPVIEELVFRGVIMGRMRWTPAWVMVIVQAVLFGAVHMNWFQSLYAFLAGLLLGYIYYKYRSIIMAIIGHMAYNLASVLIGEYLSEDTAWAMVLALAAGAVAAVVCAVFLVKRKGAVRLAAPLPVDPIYTGY